MFRAGQTVACQLPPNYSDRRDLVGRSGERTRLARHASPARTFGALAETNFLNRVRRLHLAGEQKFAIARAASVRAGLAVACACARAPQTVLDNVILTSPSLR